MYYAIRGNEGWGKVTTVYGFANRATRNMICAAIDGIEPTTAREAYRVRDEERRESRDDRSCRHSYCDMTIGEYWEDEFAPLFDEAHRLGNFERRIRGERQ